MRELVKKRLPSVMLLVLLGAALGLVPHSAPPAGLPPLSAINGPEACDILPGHVREEVHAVWGEPDGMLSGLFGDVYRLENGSSIIVYYDAEPMNEGAADASTVPVQYAVYSEF